MAATSSSSSRMSCFQCQDSSSNPEHFRTGWRLRSGEFAQLCSRCASAYDDGRFCETFHSNDDGWRDCESCGKARKRCLSLEPEVRAKEQVLPAQAPVEAQFWPRVTDLELQKVSPNPKATVTPLFEKTLSASDADLKLARLIIPKRCAENFFPDISGLHGLRIKIQDIDGNEWEFHYRYWLNGGSKIYVLEGLRDYMISKQWQPGDTGNSGDSFSNISYLDANLKCQKTRRRNISTRTSKHTSHDYQSDKLHCEGDTYGCKRGQSSTTTNHILSSGTRRKGGDGIKEDHRLPTVPKVNSSHCSMLSFLPQI